MDVGKVKFGWIQYVCKAELMGPVSFAVIVLLFGSRTQI